MARIGGECGQERGERDGWHMDMAGDPVLFGSCVKAEGPGVKWKLLQPLAMLRPHKESADEWDGGETERENAPTTGPMNIGVKFGVGQDLFAGFVEDVCDASIR